MAPKIITSLTIYPVKGLPGIELNQVSLSSTGLLYDRRFMLVDDQGKFISQRTTPKLVSLKTKIQGDSLRISCLNDSVEFLLVPLFTDPCKVEVWEDTIDAFQADKSISEWFSNQLSMHCRLVYLPDTTTRRIDNKYTDKLVKVSFADAFPLLVIGEESLKDLNSRLVQPVPMNRFRPNIVFSGGNAFEEDLWTGFSIEELLFTAAKPCARCQVITIDQETGVSGKEPLHTLNSFRRKENKVLFGMNAFAHSKEGIIKLGDQLTA